MKYHLKLYKGKEQLAEKILEDVPTNRDKKKLFLQYLYSHPEELSLKNGGKNIEREFNYTENPDLQIEVSISFTFENYLGARKGRCQYHYTFKTIEIYEEEDICWGSFLTNSDKNLRNFAKGAFNGEI